MALIQVNEFIKMAIQDEETGIAFYTALAEESDDREVADELRRIADQERTHKERFNRMLGEVADYTPREEYAGQYEAFLKTLYDTRPFLNPEQAAEKARAIGSPLEGAQLALQIEKDTLFFQQQLTKVLPGKHQHLVREIIDEEKQHLVQLAAIRDRLS